MTRAGGELIAEWTATGVREAVLDHMGSRVGWYAAGVLHKTPRDSFGRGAADIGPSGLDLDALTWHAQDPTGLVYMQARYYDPEVGRFLSEDPVQATNRYAYAFNNPVSAWDPYGLVAAIEDNKLRTTSAGSTAAQRKLGMRVLCLYDRTLGVVNAIPDLGVVGNVAYEIVVSKCGAKGAPTPPCPVGNSFEGDTLVRTPQGDVPIANIREGDLVLAYEDDGGDWFVAPADLQLGDGRVVLDGRVYEGRQGADGLELRATGEAVRRVEERSFRRVDEVYDARFRLPSGEVVTLSGTAEHPFYVPAHGGYIDLEALEEGVEVGLVGGEVGVLLGVERRFGAAWVYNFEVEGLHNYFVDGGVVVHNGRYTPGGRWLGAHACGRAKERGFCDAFVDAIVDQGTQRWDPENGSYLFSDARGNTVAVDPQRTGPDGCSDFIRTVYGRGRGGRRR